MCLPKIITGNMAKEGVSINNVPFFLVAAGMCPAGRSFSHYTIVSCKILSDTALLGGIGNFRFTFLSLFPQ